MYVNGKIRPIETVPGMGGGRDKGERLERVNLSMISLIYCNNFCKCHNALPLCTTIKK
jgi:hypothetical protein